MRKWDKSVPYWALWGICDCFEILCWQGVAVTSPSWDISAVLKLSKSSSDRQSADDKKAPKVSVAVLDPWLNKLSGKFFVLLVSAHQYISTFSRKKFIILLRTLNLQFMRGFNLLFLDVPVNFLLKMMKKSLSISERRRCHEKFDRSSQISTSWIWTSLAQVAANLKIACIFTSSSMYYCCTGHVFLLESGGELQQLLGSVYLAHWLILTDIYTSTFSTDNLLKVIELGLPFSSLIAKGSWIINSFSVSLPLTHWKRYRSFVNDNYFFFYCTQASSVFCDVKPGPQEYCEVVFFFSVFLILSHSLKITKWN